MNLRPTTVERAFQLAQSGDYDRITDISNRLKKEGYEYAQSHLSGATVVGPLRRAIAAAKAATADRAETS